jgi:hypothetical protein
MVRSDVVVSPVPLPQSAASEALPAAATADDNAVVSNVIRIASGRLC